MDGIRRFIEVNVARRQVRGSTFQSEYGVGFGFAYRLYTDMPLTVVGGYGNGGGNQHTAYVGLGGSSEGKPHGYGNLATRG